MQQSGGPPKPSSFIPLLSIIPAALLYLMSRAAFWTYNNSHYSIRDFGRNIYEPYWIGVVVWAVAAGALAAMLLVEAVLRMRGKAYEFPAMSLVLAGIWNIFMGLLGFAEDPFACGLSGYVPPDARVHGALFLAAITFGLLLAGIGAIKSRSLKGPLASAARVICLINGILAALGAIYVFFLTGCLTTGPA